MAAWELVTRAELYASLDNATTGLDVVTGTATYTTLANGRKAFNTGSAQLRKSGVTVGATGGKLTFAWRGNMGGTTPAFPDVIHAKSGAYDAATGAQAQLANGTRVVARGSSGDAVSAYIDVTVFASWVVVYDGPDVTVYRNGAVVSDSGTIAQVVPYTGDVYLASSNTGVSAAGCTVQDAVIDNRVWTAAEAADYSAGLEPTNTVAPVVSQSGPTLSCTTGDWNAWGNGTLAYRYMWYRNGQQLPGEAAATIPWRLYGPGAYKCRVRGVNDGGYWDGADTFSNTLSVAQYDSRILTDDFTGATPVAGWTTADADFILFGGAASLNMSISAGKKLAKTISTTGLRLGFTIDRTVLTSTSATTICEVKAGASVVARIGAYISGGQLRSRIEATSSYAGTGTNFNLTAGVTEFNVSTTEVRYEIALDPIRKSIYFFVDGNFRCSYYAGNSTAATLTSVELGELGGTGTGSLKLLDVAIDSDYTTPIDPNIIKVWDVVLAAGQSNMAGAVTSGWDTGTDYPGPWWSAWAEDTGTDFSQNGTYSGPRIFTSFARHTDLSEDGQPMVLLGAWGGTGFEGGAPNWAPGQTRRNYVTATLDNLLVTPPGNYPYHARAKAIIWHNGESDSGVLTAEEYMAYLAELVAEWREYTGDVPFICGGLSPAYFPTASETELGQQAVTAYIPNATFVSSRLPTAATAKVGEEIHFDGAGLRTMGERYAAAYQRMAAVQRSVRPVTRVPSRSIVSNLVR